MCGRNGGISSSHNPTPQQRCCEITVLVSCFWLDKATNTLTKKGTIAMLLTHIPTHTNTNTHDQPDLHNTQTLHVVDERRQTKEYSGLHSFVKDQKDPHNSPARRFATLARHGPDWP